MRIYCNLRDVRLELAVYSPVRFGLTKGKPDRTDEVYLGFLGFGA